MSFFFIVFILVVSFFVPYSLFSRRLFNPFQLSFYLGKKGSGKSTVLVKLMKRYLKKGYHVYTNMRECTLSGIIYIDIDLLGYYRPYENSFVALDEVGIAYDGRKFKNFRDEWRDFYKFQRKYRCIIAMASQSWDVDKKVRDLTDNIYLCRRYGPFSFARYIKRDWKIIEAEGDAESRIADTLKVGPLTRSQLTWIPGHLKAFDSFSAPELPYFEQQPSADSL